VGATLPEAKPKLDIGGFNPRARVGRDLQPYATIIGNEMFQSTRPRGARLLSRPYGLYSQLVSIHAPAWGATPSIASRISRINSFNPRARVGRDPILAD